MTDHPIFTIGHSNHSLEGFLALLSKHHVTVVVDVRSVPWSRFNAHFNRNELSAALKARGIHYAYLGRELGGRPEDPALHDEESGKVSYERIARTGKFRQGVARVVSRAARHRIALMCAEKDPLRCHRTHLVAQALGTEGVEVLHILADGEIEHHARTMDRSMVDSDARPNEDLFPDALIEETTKNLSRRIAFVGRNSVSELGREDR